MTDTIFDLEIPKVIVPVRNGRNLATIIEVGAMTHRLKYMGFNAAYEFTRRLDAEIARKKEKSFESSEH